MTDLNSHIGVLINGICGGSKVGLTKFFFLKYQQIMSAKILPSFTEVICNWKCSGFLVITYLQIFVFGKIGESNLVFGWRDM